MKNLRLLNLCMILAVTFLYTFGGCAGGGGGGGGGGGDDDDGGNAITFSGLTNPAEISELNAEDLTGGAFGAGLIGDGMMGLSLNQGPNDTYIRKFRTVKVPQILSHSLDLIDFTSLSTSGVQAAITTESDTIDGNCGGSMSYSVRANDLNGDFSGNFNFSNYCNDGTTINGGARFEGRMNVNAGDFLEAYFSFDNLSGGNLTLNGDIEIDFTASPKRISFNAYGQDRSSGKVYWIRDYSITIDENTGFVQIEMNGRFYHPDHGYVTLSTTVPFELHEEDEWPTAGALVITGANDSKAKITAIDNVYCTVEADIDGDDAYEWDSGTRSWEDI